MKINKGMYARVKELDSTSIVKVLEIDQFDNDGFKADNNMYYLFSDIIGEPSFDIIDLIKVGDYVNGNKVTKLGFDKLLLHCKTIECHQEDLSRGYEGVTFMYTNSDITDIVTKEQFNSMKYVVERDK